MHMHTENNRARRARAQGKLARFQREWDALSVGKRGPNDTRVGRGARAGLGDVECECESWAFLINLFVKRRGRSERALTRPSRFGGANPI